MTKNALRLTLAAALLAPALALAQASVQLRLDLPVVMPQLVVVQPGIQVVPNVEEEVFFTSGWYWVRQDGGWYRSHSPRGGGWYYVQPERVPHGLVKIPPGHYRRWQPPRPRAAQAPRPAPARYAPPPAPYGGDHGHGDHDGGHGKGGHGKGGKNDGKGHGNGHGHD
jgi:hypothetical protein